VDLSKNSDFTLCNLNRLLLYNRSERRWLCGTHWVRI